ncbi:MAG: DNA internalization-related competence protein ComEC/Rec2 [bacterium]
MIVFSALLVSGICVGHYLNLPIYILLISLAISIPLIFLIKFRFISSTAIFLSLFLLGAVLITSSVRYIPKNDISNYTEGNILKIEGKVDSYLDRRDNKAYLYIKPKRVIDGDRQIDVSGRLRATIYGEIKEKITYGDNITLTGRLVLPRGRTNPGGFDYKGWLLIRGVRALLYVNKIDSISSGWGNPLLMLSYWLRERSIGFIENLSGGGEGALLKGMLIGERESIPENIVEEFRRAGVIHIIAISGQNLSLIGFATFLILSTFGLSKRLSAIIVMPVIVLYSIMTGFDPPVVRALIMGLLVLTGLVFEFKVSLLNIIGTTMIVFLLFNPSMLFDVSFQLSFSATLGIAILYNPISRFLHHLPTFFTEMVSATLSAQIGVMPLIMYHFYNVSLVSFIANLVIIPISSLTMVIGFISLILSYPISYIGITFGEISGQMSGALIYLTHIFSQFQWSYLNIPRQGFDVVLILYISIILMVFFVIEKLRRLSVIVLCSTFAFYGLGLLMKPPPPDMRLTFLSIGDGRSIVLEEQKKCYIIDCGSKSGGESAYNTLKSYLNMRGIKKIDLLIISHPHSDHINGLSILLSEFPVSSLYTIPYPYPTKTFTDMLGSIKNTTKFCGVLGKISLSNNNRTIINLYAPLNLPPIVKEGNYPNNDDMNSSAIINIIRYKGLSIYLPSDNEDYYNELKGKYQVVEFPHHGSENRGVWKLIDNSNTKAVIISSGRSFREKLDEFYENLNKIGTILLSTDDCGAITLEVRGERCTLKTEY